MKALFLGSDAYERDADGKRDETEATECTIFGLTFHCGQPLDISWMTDVQKDMLSQSRMFRVIDSDTATVRLVSDKTPARRGRPPRVRISA